MGPAASHTGLRAAVLAAGAALLLAGAGCGKTHTDLANGKQLFAARCGTCHTLARAGSKGIQGPNLDQAFDRSRKDGFRSDTIESVVHGQILYPNANGIMPAKLVTGKDAHDVAAYVAQVAAKPGKDSGLLASIGQTQSNKTVTAKGGKAEIDMAQAGLAFAAKAATAPAGKLTVTAKNPQSTDHNIAVKGPGLSPALGKVVNKGGVSTVTVNLKPGTYEFFCSVDGHEAAGMKGTLTVK